MTKKLTVNHYKMLSGFSAIYKVLETSEKVKIVGVAKIGIMIEDKQGRVFDTRSKYLTPIMRPLTSITAKERKELANMNPSYHLPCIFNKTVIEHNIDVEHVPYLLDKGFD